MKSLNLCLSLALLLCLQAYAADSQDPLAGIWSKPDKKIETSGNCCIPDSIEIVKSGSSYKGIYSYKMLNLKCQMMFAPSNLAEKGDSVDIAKKSNSDAYGFSVYFPFHDIEGHNAKVLSSSQLEIYNVKNGTDAEASTCLFTMTVFKPASSSSNSLSSIPVSYLAMGAGVLLLVLCIACKCRQKKQIVIIQQESGYGAPNMYHPNQPYYGQKGPIIQTR
jgi:hypothetical protein